MSSCTWFDENNKDRVLLRRKKKELLPNVNDKSVLRGSQTDKIFKTKTLKNYTSIKGYKH